MQRLEKTGAVPLTAELTEERFHGDDCHDCPSRHAQPLSGSPAKAATTNALEVLDNRKGIIAAKERRIKAMIQFRDGNQPIIDPRSFTNY